VDTRRRSLTSIDGSGRRKYRRYWNATQAHCVVSSQSGSLTQDQNGPFAARAEGAEKSTLAFLMAVQHRGTKWTPEENRRLLDLIKAGKSWVFISANLKRPVKSIRIRLKLLRAKGK
jgi:hypothetical protein